MAGATTRFGHPFCSKMSKAPHSTNVTNAATAGSGDANASTIDGIPSPTPTATSRSHPVALPCAARASAIGAAS
jgi:hypothetical protein